MTKQFSKFLIFSVFSLLSMQGWGQAKVSDVLTSNFMIAKSTFYKVILIVLAASCIFFAKAQAQTIDAANCGTVTVWAGTTAYPLPYYAPFSTATKCGYASEVTTKAPSLIYDNASSKWLLRYSVSQTTGWSSTVNTGILAPNTTVGNWTKIFSAMTDLTGTLGTEVVTNLCTAPTVFNVTSTTTTFCQGSDGVEIKLSGSQSGLKYQLYNGSTAVGSPVNGTGSTLSFGKQMAGTYTVKALESIVQAP